MRQQIFSIVLWTCVFLTTAQSSPVQNEDPLPEFRVLCIDGGGVRGKLPLQFLIQLEEKLHRTPKGIKKTPAEIFHMIAGTSIGGIVTLALANGKSAEALNDVFNAYAPQLFAKPTWGSWFKSGAGLWGSKYANIGAFADVLFRPGTTLKNLTTTALVTAWDVGLRRPMVFKSWNAALPHENYKLWDVARATSAAPTYFPPALIESMDGTHHLCLDGGVRENNPTVLAYAAIQELMRHGRLPRVRPVILSLGTGELPPVMTQSQLSGETLLGAAETVLEIATSTTSAHNTMMQLMDPFDYFRWNPEVPADLSPLDQGDSEHLNKLDQFACSHAATYAAFDILVKRLNTDKAPINILAPLPAALLMSGTQTK